MKLRWWWGVVLVAAAGLRLVERPVEALPAATVRVAVIGDYGKAGPSAAAVAAMVAGWNPDFVITTGDNNYPDGAAATIDANIGQYYQSFIGSYAGAYGPGSGTNRFFPSLGNHDWIAPNAQPYLDYFSLPSDSPGGERYYTFTWGPLQLFALDADPHEPHGITATSRQAQWLQCALLASTAPWQVVFMHHAPFSSGLHGSTLSLQWPYRAWGADLVLSGHDHHYERLIVNGLPYFVVGTGGASLYPVGSGVAGSQKVDTSDYGAQLIVASETSLTIEYYWRTGDLVDSLTLDQCAVGPALPERVFLPLLLRPTDSAAC